MWGMAGYIIIRSVGWAWFVFAVYFAWCMYTGVVRIQYLLAACGLIAVGIVVIVARAKKRPSK